MLFLYIEKIQSISFHPSVNQLKGWADAGISSPVGWRSPRLVPSQRLTCESLFSRTLPCGSCTTNATAKPSTPSWSSASESRTSISAPTLRTSCKSVFLVFFLKLCSYSYATSQISIWCILQLGIERLRKLTAGSILPPWTWKEREKSFGCKNDFCPICNSPALPPTEFFAFFLKLIKSLRLPFCLWLV